MADTFQEATFGFRFLCLSGPELSRLRQLIPAVRLTTRPRPEGFVVSFDLTECFDLESLCAFIVDSGVGTETYSVWISLIASGDQGGVALPAHVLRAIRQTSGGVDVSFASCLGDAASEST
jgi:hypothetical protein